MKKFFFLALALAVCSFTFVSCEKEKDKDSGSESNYGQTIVGTWKYTRYWDGDDKKWYDVDEEDFDLAFYIFDSKGNFTQKYTDGEFYSYKYHIEKDIIYIGDEEDGNWKDWDASYRISSISSEKMLLLGIDGDYKMEFEKQ